MAAGWSHTVGIKTDGSLWAWGLNNYGQLGLGTADLDTPSEMYKYIPAKVGNGWQSVSAGADYTIGIKTDGSLWTWGLNQSGQLGLGKDTLGGVPIPVKVGDGWRTISAGDYHAVAIKTDGSLWAWGNNSAGQLGDGTKTERNTPIKVGDGWQSVSAGSLHTIGIKSDGSLWAWGTRSILGIVMSGSESIMTIPIKIVP